MPELWGSINEMNSELIDDDDFNHYSSKSYQNIFGFPYTCSQLKDGTEYDGRFVSDDAFWTSNEYPYIFTILVQFFDRDKKEWENALKEKIATYLDRLIAHIKINFDDYENVFSLNLEKPEGGEPASLPRFSPNEEDKEYILTDYVTFDRYDYILCVKAKCYLPFVLAEQQLHSLPYSEKREGFSSVGSFTVTAVNHMYTGRIPDEIIPSICIKCNYAEDRIVLYNQQKKEEIIRDPETFKFNVLNYMHSYQKKLRSFLYDQNDIALLDSLHLDNYFKMYYINGENDIRFISRYVRASRVVHMISDAESLLRESYLTGFSTSINVTNNDYDEFNPEDTAEPSGSSLCKKIIECKNMIRELSEKGFPAESIKIMNQINSGLSAIMPQNMYYRGYGFFSLFPDFYALIKRTHHEFIVTAPPCTSKEVPDKIQELIQFIGSALLTTMRSDFKEFQIPTFNANLYYAPTKLLVFYRAFIKYFMEYYKPFYEKSKDEYGEKSEQKSDQHFFIAPGNKFGAIVFEKVGGTYDNDTISERYFICEINEKNIYYLKNTLIILSHEISHYGLKTIRNRKDRYAHIVNTYISAFLIFLFSILTQKISSSIHKAAPGLEESVEKKALYCLSNSFTNEEIHQKLFNRMYRLYSLCDDKNRREEKNKYHYCKIILALESNFLEIKDEVRKEVFNTVFFELQEVLFDMKEEPFDIATKLELNETIKTLISDSFENAYQMSFSNWNYKKLRSVHRFISYHYREVFSDILCILTLDLTPQDYYEILMEEKSGKIIKNSTAPYRNIDYRFSLVVDSLINSQKKLAELSTADRYRVIKEKSEKLFHFENWKADPFPSDIASAYRETKKRLFGVFSTPNDYENAYKWYREIKADDKHPIRSLFYDNGIYQNIVEYMTGCVVSYFKQMDETGIDEKELSPRSVYNKINSSDIPYYEKIFGIDGFLGRFENEQFALLEETVPE
jgi:hypothetical protein